MRDYSGQHRFYCAVDLRARSMYVCVINRDGDTQVNRNLPTDGKMFLKVIEPYREDIVVAVECVFLWYWVADLCAEEGIPLILGHALYMKAIHGGKAKNDKIDSEKLVRMLRSQKRDKITIEIAGLMDLLEKFDTLTKPIEKARQRFRKVLGRDAKIP